MRCPPCRSAAAFFILILRNWLDISQKSEDDPRHPASIEEGRFGRSSRYVERGMRWTRWRRAWSFVRTNGADADAKARGPGLPTLRPRRVVTSRATTGARKPGSRGERAISVKTIAQGRPDYPAEPVVPSPCFFIARGPRVSVEARPSLRPLTSGGPTFSHDSDTIVPRDRGVAFGHSHCEAQCADLSAFARSDSTNDARRHRPRRRVIRYAAAYRLEHCRLWTTGSPGQAGR
jgi:hypothetical protein